MAATNCGLPDGVIHMHSDQCYNAGRRDALATPLASPLTTHVVLGAVWVERDGVRIRVDADELLPLMRSLRAHLDALEDAR